MKELAEYFSGKGQVKGYVFNQIKRTDNAYLYEVKGDEQIHYEVFERRENALYECVSYPSDKAFGIWAFTCMSMSEAILKLYELDVRVETRKLSQNEIN